MKINQLGFFYSDKKCLPKSMSISSIIVNRNPAGCIYFALLYSLYITTHFMYIHLTFISLHQLYFFYNLQEHLTCICIFTIYTCCYVRNNYVHFYFSLFTFCSLRFQLYTYFYLSRELCESVQGSIQNLRQIPCLCAHIGPINEFKILHAIYDRL